MIFGIPRRIELETKEHRQRQRYKRAYPKESKPPNAIDQNDQDVTYPASHPISSHLLPPPRLLRPIRLPRRPLRLTNLTQSLRLRLSFLRRKLRAQFPLVARGGAFSSFLDPPVSQLLKPFVHLRK